jgi:hypothetical protein
MAQYHPGGAETRLKLTDQIKQLQGELAALEFRHSGGEIASKDYHSARNHLNAEYDAALNHLCALYTNQQVPARL